MYHSPIDEESAVAFHEERRGKPLAWVLHLRVTKREPYFLHLAIGEKAVDDLDIGAQERDILQSLIQSLRGSRPHTRAFDIHPDEIHIGI